MEFTTRRQHVGRRFFPGHMHADVCADIRRLVVVAIFTVPVNAIADKVTSSDLWGRERTVVSVC